MSSPGHRRASRSPRGLASPSRGRASRSPRGRASRSPRGLFLRGTSRVCEAIATEAIAGIDVNESEGDHRVLGFEKETLMSLGGREGGFSALSILPESWMRSEEGEAFWKEVIIAAMTPATKSKIVRAKNPVRILRNPQSAPIQVDDRGNGVIVNSALVQITVLVNPVASTSAIARSKTKPKLTPANLS